MKSFYMNGEEIKAFFKCSQSTYLHIRKVIKEHPERYTHYAIVDRLTSAPAFADAKAFASRLRKGDATLPPYEPDKAMMMMGVLHNVG